MGIGLDMSMDSLSPISAHLDIVTLQPPTTFIMNTLRALYAAIAETRAVFFAGSVRTIRSQLPLEVNAASKTVGIGT